MKPKPQNDSLATKSPAVDPAYLRVPPQSIEAEESLLSAVLLDNDPLFDVVELLRPADFYKRSHQLIFEAVMRLFSKNEPVDLVTLVTALSEAGKLEEAGGAAYLAGIVESAPVAVNARYYAKIIRDRSSLRRLIDTAADITRRCYEAGGEIAQIVDFAEQSIFEIAEKNASREFAPLERLIRNNIGKLEELQGQKKLITGVTSGFSRLDELTSGFQPADLIILAARPGMGKTAFALNLARNAAVDAEVPTAVFSLEMSQEQLSMRMLCAEARVDAARLRSGFFSNEDWEKLTDAADILSQAPIYIDDSPDATALEIRAKSRRLKMKANLGLIIVDYLQLMRSPREVERRDLEISEISRSLKGLAKELDVPVVALSQLNRKLEERSDKRPILSDLRESGALEQDADVVAFIYREEVYKKEEQIDPAMRNKAEIILGKQRNGPLGTISLNFINTYTRFENPAPDYYVD